MNHVDPAPRGPAAHARPALRHVAAACLVFTGTLAMANPPATQTRRFHLDAAPATVMPLFSAEGERRWAPGWEPQMLSGDGGRGSVFRTRAHDRDTTWVVIDWRPEQGIAGYARLVDGINMGLVDVRVTGAHAGSDVQVTYTLTALSPDAQPHVDAFLAAQAYTDFIEGWRSAIAAALREPAASR